MEDTVVTHTHILTVSGYDFQLWPPSWPFLLCAVALAIVAVVAGMLLTIRSKH